MRCPQCTERNSVAARKCEFCGEKFKRKPVPLGFKLAVAGVAVAATASVAASYVVPKFVDPGQNLARVAKKVAAGPRSVEDAHRGKTELATAIRDYLKNNGNSKSADLTAGLQKLLPSSTYEVHIAELPRGLRVVEVDTLLQATDYLVMKTSSGTKVFDLPGFEVFDDGRIINDTAPVLVLVGHSGGQPPHRPQVKAYALLPDSVNDETDKLVPKFAGEGQAKFAMNGQDIQLQLYPSTKTAKNSHQPPSYGLLHWKDARYNAEIGTKTASNVRAHFNDETAKAPAPTPAASTPTVAAQVAATPTASSTALRVAAVASPAVAKVIEQAKASSNHGAKIVVRGLTDKPTPVAAALQGKSATEVTTSKSLLSSLPGAQVGTGGQERREVPKKTETAAAPKPAVSSTRSSGSTRYGTIAVNGATLRADRHRTSAALSGLGHGERLEILGFEHDWYHVRVNGQTGYVFGPLVDTSGKVAAASAPTETVSSASTGSSSRRHRRHGHNNTVLVADVTSRSTSTENAPAAEGRSRHKRKRQSAAAVVEAPTLVP